MRLTLTVLRCPPAVTPETRTVTGGEFTAGRGPGVDWVLPDAEQVVSKRHFAAVFRAGAWQIIDHGANGTFLNRDTAPIGQGNARTLRNADRLRVGPYEIEVHLAEQEETPRDAAYGGSTAAHSPFDDPLGHAFAPVGGNPFDEPWAPASDPGSGPASIPTAFDPLAPADGGSRFGAAFQEAPQQDHSSVLDDAYRPPARIGQMPVHAGGLIPADDLLPAGWETDFLDGLAPETPPDAARDAPATGEASPFESSTAVSAEPSATRPAVAPAPAVSPFDEEPPPVPCPAASAGSPGLSPQTPPIGWTPGDDSRLLARFLAGVGLPDAKPGDPGATMKRLGEAFRALVAGLRSVLIARASIKSEFRIDQTMFRARGNNPLKFSADDDDAVAALLGVGRRTGMTPAQAIADVLRDIELHELASMAAMQSAVRAVLDGLGPDRLRAEADQGGMALLPVQRKARAWDTYEARHAKTVQALSDDFDSVFGKAFARAYEEAMADLAAGTRQ